MFRILEVLHQTKTAIIDGIICVDGYIIASVGINEVPLGSA